MRRLLLILFVVAAALLLVGATPAAAATVDNDDGGVMVRLGGDATVTADDDVALVVVVGGDLDLTGPAETVVVVDGTARLDGATVDELVVVSGTAILGPDTTVSGDVNLVDSTIEQDPSAVVEGDIDTDPSFALTSGLWVVSFIIAIGWAILLVLAGLALAAVAPRLARGAGRTATGELGRSALAALVLWLVVPIVSVLVFATVIGIPVAVTVLLMVLPAMAFVGLVVGSVRLGELLVSGGQGQGHPYLAATVGTALMAVVGFIPFLGPLALTVVAFFGSGALALHAVRAARAESSDTPAWPEPAPPVPTTG